MNKKQFLKELEKRLQILAETERRDILDEYKDTIEEKVKHGQTEVEAVTDFGNLDELTEEILSAYKINPNYGKKEDEISDKAKKVLKDGESLVKQCAHKLSDFTKDIVEDVKSTNHDITVEFIFEIIIKAIILLVVCALLRIPFWLLQQLGLGILSAFFPPVDTVLGVLWVIILGIFYFLACILIAFAMFREYFNGNKKNRSEKKDEVKEDIKKETKETKEKTEENETKAESKTTKKKVVSEEKKEEVIIERPIIQRKNTTADAVTLVVKVLVTIFLLIPLWCIQVCLWVGLAFIIYYLCQGLPVVGILVILLGLIFLFGNISDIFYRVAYGKKHIYGFMCIVGLCMIMVGGLLTIDTVSKFEYYDVAPIEMNQRAEKTYTESLLRDTRISVRDGKVDIVEDATVAPGTMMIKVYYYEDYIHYSYNRDNNQNSFDSIRIGREYYYQSRQNRRKIYDLVLDNLKNHEFYDYHELHEVEVKVMVNPESRNLIR